MRRVTRMGCSVKAFECGKEEKIRSILCSKRVRVVLWGIARASLLPSLPLSSTLSYENLGDCLATAWNERSGRRCERSHVGSAAVAAARGGGGEGVWRVVGDDISGGK